MIDLLGDDNLSWPSPDPNDPVPEVGRFALAASTPTGTLLRRDGLGLNKLYTAWHDDTLHLARYLADLTERDIPWADIYAVPAGATVLIAPDGKATYLHELTRQRAAPPGPTDPAAVEQMRELLDAHMARLADLHPYTPVVVCLSGGADSSLVAALTARHFPHVVAYTYSFASSTGPSDDLRHARLVADHLQLPHRIVTADADAILDAVEPAIRYGQDWRDFNVHAAIVNELLAAAIAADFPAGALVLTGDLANELLGDYTPVRFADRDYYTLPRLPMPRLRDALLAGIQTGDREVGVFAAHGLTVAQPYGWIHRHLLAWPSNSSKQLLVQALDRQQLPDQVLTRAKVRAQIADATPTEGILGVLQANHLDQPALEGLFRELHQVPTSRALHATIRGGYHQPLQGARAL